MARKSWRCRWHLHDLSNPIGHGERVLEQGKVGRRKRIPDKQHRQCGKQSCRHRLEGSVAHGQVLCQMPLQQKCSSRSHIKNSNVHPHNGNSQRPSIAVIKQWDKQKASYSSYQLCCPISLTAASKHHGNQSCQKQRHKQQLHMLPCGFIDGRKSSHNGIFSTPFIEKMKQRSGSAGKQESTDPPLPACVFHLHPPLWFFPTSGHSICLVPYLYSPQWKEKQH